VPDNSLAATIVVISFASRQDVQICQNSLQILAISPDASLLRFWPSSVDFGAVPRDSDLSLLRHIHDGVLVVDYTEVNQTLTDLEATRSEQNSDEEDDMC
jgi:hypothetical protein